MQQTEAEGRLNLYDDVTPLEKTNNINVLTAAIRKKTRGADVREAIATAIETTYADGTANGNTNMEVALARGTHPNLRSRLEEVDNKQQQTISQLEQTNSQLVQKVGLGKKAEMEDLSDTVISAMTGGATVNLLSVPQDRSVTPIKKADSIIPVVKDLNNYIDVSTDTYFYVPKGNPLQKGLVNFVGNFKGGTVRLFLVEKDGLRFNVIAKKTVSVTPGINTIFTNFITKGTGNEYLGLVGGIRFKTTGGEGMYENPAPPVDFESINTTLSTAGSTFDFAIYPTYEYQEIIDKINTKLDIDTEKLVYSNVGETLIKDFTSFTEKAMYPRTYIPNSVLDIGNIVVHFKGITQTGTFYILERTGSSFTVKKALSVSLVDGVNTVDMGYYNDGSVDTYFGFFAQSYFKTTGGKGMYEADRALTEGQSYTLIDSTRYEYDFGYYIEYTGPKIELKEAIKDLYSNVEDIRKEIKAPISSKLQLTDYSLPKYKEIPDPVGYVGRWFDISVNGVSCKGTINAGSEFYFKVSNTPNVDVIFEPNHATQTPYFAYSIDGGPLVRQLITVPRLPELTTGEHLIRVVIDGLTEGENKWVGEKGIAFNRVEVASGGTITGILPMNKKGEFYGDSITEGVRVLNMDANANGNSASGAYPFIACDKLNAISHRVGFGATGATKGGSGGVPKLSEVIDNMTKDRKVPYHIPDFIVINHGTNDSAADSATFKANYNLALERLKIKYSGVPIFTMIPFNQQHAQDIRDCVADKSYCYLVETSSWNVTFTDGVHPDINGGIVAGTKLAEHIEATLGKSFFMV
ncbi:SGNH/GDSL hydrolase family protein [Streptococcus thermophilus]